MHIDRINFYYFLYVSFCFLIVFVPGVISAKML